MKELKKGAEAELIIAKYADAKCVIKKRIKKNYRDELLDQTIRKRRTRSEAKIIKNLKGIVNVPELFNVDEVNAEITMEFIDGAMLKDVIDKKKELCTLAGEEIKKIHDNGIIHGDLTTSNMIYKKDKKLYFIDFGLGYFSKKIEDLATDLIVFKKTFNATHSEISGGWALVIKGYAPSKALMTQMEKIEKRARYH